jgi:murein DD-endopeptidase MepM/ murein hydrolase activator NlpD
VKLGAATATLPGEDPVRKAARDMEAILLRQMLRSSGVYGGGEGAGASVRADLFVNALADAVERAGGLGLAETLSRAMGAEPASPAAAPATAVAPRTGAPTPLFPNGLAAGTVTPLAGHLTSAFGRRIDPFTGAEKEHDGVDVGAPEGSAIRATSAGVVQSAGPRGGYGQAVEIDHGNGLTTLYGHASELLVQEGDVVQAGQEIARVGSTGRSTGPHLHFEVRVGGRPIDPARVLKVYAARADTDPRSGP